MFLMADLVARARSPKVPHLTDFKAGPHWNFHVGTQLEKVLDNHMKRIFPEGARALSLADLVTGERILAKERRIKCLISA